MLGYLIDMDGVIYRGGQLIPGADRFINELRAGERPVPLPDQQQPAHPARRGHAAAAPGHRRGRRSTSSPAPWRRPASWPSRSRSGTAFVIGEGGLLTALHENGYAIVDNDPDYVVVGEGRTLNFEMVEAALGMILGGAKLVATNLDPNCPTRGGPAPGLRRDRGHARDGQRRQGVQRRQAQPGDAAGRPQGTGLTTDQTVVIGDTMETDILGGVQLGFKTILVLSGGTRREDLARYAYRPDKIVASIADLDPVELQHEFGTGSSSNSSSSITAFHPSHRSAP